MCTASWFFTDHGYELFFNRDELRSRRRALAPSHFQAGNLDALAPTDADAGGTWLAANSHGLTVALLNRYQDSSPCATPSRRRSRGLLVRDLVSETGIPQVLDQLKRLDPTVYDPFTLLLLDPQGEARTLFWNGRQVSKPTRAVAPLASSGHEPLSVPEARLQLWAALGKPDRQSCLRFHGSHQPERGAISPCMHRPDARTVSLTHVRVDNLRVAMDYADGPPCSAGLLPAAQLPRTPATDADAA